MSLDKFDDDCPGCRPALIDVRTGKVFHSSHPAVQAVNRVWARTTKEEREAFHQVTCLNNHTPAVLGVVMRLTKEIQNAISAAEN